MGEGFPGAPAGLKGEEKEALGGGDFLLVVSDVSEGGIEKGFGDQEVVGSAGLLAKDAELAGAEVNVLDVYADGFAYAEAENRLETEKEAHFGAVYNAHKPLQFLVREAFVHGAILGLFGAQEAGLPCGGEDSYCFYQIPLGEVAAEEFELLFNLGPVAG